MSQPSSQDPSDKSLEDIRDFYDSVYYKSTPERISSSSHLRALARRIGVESGWRVLDVACGRGEWLLACQEKGAIPHGIDLSERAVAVCLENLKEGEYEVGAAETLPWPTDSFDLVSCLGALEHFVDPQEALREMVRVARPGAPLLLLVPNAGFLTRRLGLYGGTKQTDAKEDVRTLEGWADLFAEAGLKVDQRWADLHVVNRYWIFAKGWQGVVPRLLQAAALFIWPLRWQYQVYHLCCSSDSAQSG